MNGIPTTANTPKTSVWDLVRGNNGMELGEYLEMLASHEDLDSSKILVARILDQRVNQSTRFKFHNPVLGVPGYFHVNDEKEVDIQPSLTTPLHYAVSIKSDKCIPVLLKFCADCTLMNQNNETPLNLIKADMVEIASIFKSFKDFPHQQRRRIRELTNVNTKLSQEREDAVEKLQEMEEKRETFKNKVKLAALTSLSVMRWKLAIGIIRSQRLEEEARLSLKDLKSFRKQVELAEQEKRTWFQDKKILQEQNNALRIKASEAERDLNELQLIQQKNGNAKDLLNLQRERLRTRELAEEVEISRKKIQTLERMQSISIESSRNSVTEANVSNDKVAYHHSRPFSDSESTARKHEVVEDLNDKINELKEELEDLNSAFNAVKDLLNEEKDKNKELEQEIDKLKTSSPNSNLKITPKGCCIIS